MGNQADQGIQRFFLNRPGEKKPSFSQATNSQLAQEHAQVFEDEIALVTQ